MSPTSRGEASRDDELAPEVPALKPVLIYIGQGAALPNIPARDIQADELAQLAGDVGPHLMGHGGEKSLTKLLVESGLYKEA